MNATAPPTAGADRAAGIGVVLAACVSAFVVNANTSAVTILLPTMSEDTGTPIARLQWAVTGYLLVGAAVIVTWGALGDVLGRRQVFLAGLALLVTSCVFHRAMARHHQRTPNAVDLVAPAAASSHTIPTRPVTT